MKLPVVLGFFAFINGSSAWAKEPEIFGISIKMTFADFEKKFANEMKCDDHDDWRECEVEDVDPIAKSVSVSFRKPWGDRAYRIHVNFRKDEHNMPTILHKDIANKLVVKFGPNYRETAGDFGVRNRHGWRWAIGNSEVSYAFFTDEGELVRSPTVANSIEISSNEHEKWLQERKHGPAASDSADRAKRSKL